MISLNYSIQHIKFNQHQKKTCGVSLSAHMMLLAATLTGWLRNAFLIISLKCSVLILLFLLLGRRHDTPTPSKWSGQHLFLWCPSPFGVLRGTFCRPCHLMCFRAQRSPASAYLKVHPETLWPWDVRPHREGFQSGQFRCFLSVRHFRTLFCLHN